MHLTGRSFDEKWILQALILYVFVGLCWLPVVWMQIKMRDIVQTSILEKTNLPKNYWQFERWWVILGAIAFPAVIYIFYLMVFKPV